MTNTEPHTPGRPITARAAQNGLYISGCIFVLIILFSTVLVFPLSGLLVWIGSFAMPFITYRLLKSSDKECGGTMSFAEIWAEGIASYFLGSLLPAAVCYLLLRFAFPSFIADQMNGMIDTLNAIGTEEAKAYVGLLEDLRNKTGLPGPVDIAANLISFNIVAGTAVSLLVAPFVRMRRYKTTSKQ